jgi:NACHT domain
VNVLMRHLPSGAGGVVAVIFALAAIVTALAAILRPVWAILRLAWHSTARRWSEPSGQQADFLHRRQMFAARVLGQLTELDSHESWQDNRFTELEAEVEITEGRERIFRRWRRSPTRHVTLRLEKSLTRALERSHDPLILLEGEPGSGKSIALRHLATQLAGHISGRGTDRAEIPLYINLKGFRPDGFIGADAVRDFILKTVSQMNDADVDRFVSDALDGKEVSGSRRSGASWLLLFDSFDEIPDILSATDSNQAVRDYAQAINDFVTFRQDRIRSIVASREFRGPTGFGLTRFRIISLNDRQQKILIRRTRLDPEIERRVVEGAATAGPEFGTLARNPMFLALVCEYARRTGQFPDNVHTVYETYLDSRLQRDMDILSPRYGLTAGEMRACAENAAYCMAAIDGLGLSPTREALTKEMKQEGSQDSDLIDRALNALVTTKLGRGSDQLGGVGAQVFTFTHRRIQEYFATCVVLRRPGLVPPEQLLTDGRWRETAVTILQTQTSATAQPLLAAASAQLRTGLAQLPSSGADSRFSWPEGTRHLLGILTQGLGRNPDQIDPSLRELAGKLVSRAWEAGRREDKAAALGVVLCSRDLTVQQIFDQAFSSDSGLLRERAFQQLAWLRDLPASVHFGIRRILVGMWANSNLWQKRTAVRVQLHRIPQGSALLRAHTILFFILPADIVLLVAAASLANAMPRASWAPWPIAYLALALAHFGLRIIRDGMADSSASQSRQGPAMRIIRRALPRGAHRQITGDFLRWASAAVVVMSLLLAPHRSLMTIAVIIVLIAAVAWPDLALEYVISSYRTWWNSVKKWWKALDWSGIGIGVLYLLGFAAAAAAIAGIVWGVQKLGRMGWDAAGLPKVHAHGTHADGTVVAVVGISIGAIAVVAAIVGLTSAAIRIIRENKASSQALKAINDRSVPYSANEMVATLKLLNSRYAIKAFIQALRMRPRVCSPDALEILSDLAAGADEKLRRVAKDSEVPISPGSCSQYTDWAGRKDGSLQRIVNRFDQSAIDNVALLTEQVHALGSA